MRVAGAWIGDGVDIVADGFERGDQNCAHRHIVVGDQHSSRGRRGVACGRVVMRRHIEARLRRLLRAGGVEAGDGDAAANIEAKRGAQAARVLGAGDASAEVAHRSMGGRERKTSEVELAVEQRGNGGQVVGRAAIVVQANLHMGIIASGHGDLDADRPACASTVNRHGLPDGNGDLIGIAFKARIQRNRRQRAVEVDRSDRRGQPRDALAQRGRDGLAGVAALHRPLIAPTGRVQHFHLRFDRARGLEDLRRGLRHLGVLGASLQQLHPSEQREQHIVQVVDEQPTKLARPLRLLKVAQRVHGEQLAVCGVRIRSHVGDYSKNRTKAEEASAFVKFYASCRS